MTASGTASCVPVASFVVQAVVPLSSVTETVSGAAPDVVTMTGTRYWFVDPIRVMARFSSRVMTQPPLTTIWMPGAAGFWSTSSRPRSVTESGSSSKPAGMPFTPPTGKVTVMVPGVWPTAIVPPGSTASEVEESVTDHVRAMKVRSTSSRSSPVWAAKVPVSQKRNCSAWSSAGGAPLSTVSRVGARDASSWIEPRPGPESTNSAARSVIDARSSR